MKFYSEFYDFKTFKPGWTVKLLRWNPSYKLIAVVLSPHIDSPACEVYVIEGNEIDPGLKANKNHLVLRRDDGTIQNFSWHPSTATFVISWGTGSLDLVQCDGEIKVKAIEVPHKSPLLLLEWNNLGSRIVTVDENGLVVFWRAFAGNQVHTLTEFQATEEVTHAVLLDGAITEQRADITELARAAVAGDENALDAMGPRMRPKTGRSMPASIVTSKGLTAVYVVTKSGVVIYAEESGANFERMRLGSSVIETFYEEVHCLLVVVTSDLAVSVFKSTIDGTLEEVSRVKLSRWRNGSLKIKWLNFPTPLIAVSTGSLAVRLWDPVANDSIVLNIETSVNHKGVEVVTAIDSHYAGLLALGTSLGNVIVFECNDMSVLTEDHWRALPFISVSGDVADVHWSKTDHVTLTAISNQSVKMFKDQVAVNGFSEMSSAVQTGPSTIHLRHLAQEKEMTITVEYCILKMALSSRAILLWNGQRVTVYEAMWDLGRAKVAGSFAFTSHHFQISCDKIYCLEPPNIVIRGIAGDVIQTLYFSTNQGAPSAISANGKCVACVTDAKVLKVWVQNEDQGVYDLHVQPKNLQEELRCLQEVQDVQVSAKGSFVSVIYQSKQVGVQELAVFNSKTNCFQVVNLTSQKLPDHLRLTKIPRCYWDCKEDRVLVLEGFYEREEQTETYIISLILSADGHIYTHDVFQLPPSKSLIGVALPYYASLVEESSGSGSVVAEFLPDFEGFKDEEGSVSILVDFSFYMYEDDLDKAFRAIRNIKSHSVWRKLARLCIQSKRVEAALMCASYLGQVHAIWAADAEREDSGKLIVLAVHFDMLQEAEDMCQAHKRNDWLLKLYQFTNRWEEVLHLSQSDGSIARKAIHYRYAKFLEMSGRIEEALDHYEKADCAAAEVSRIFVGKEEGLHEYCSKSSNRDIHSWYAKYLESQGDFSSSLLYHEKSGDLVSLCRSLCCRNELERACDTAWHSGNAAACYFIGRQLEVLGYDLEKACQYYAKAGAYGTGLRLCKENDMDHLIYPMALHGSPKDQLFAAAHLESRSPTATAEAARLYAKAGYPLKALELATKVGSSDLMQEITENIPTTSDVEMALSVAQSVELAGLWQPAVKMYAIAGQITKAINLAQSHSVQLTTELVTLLTPPDTLPPTDISDLNRILAQLCVESHLYSEAAQKFNQVGDKLAAVNALEKLGDMDKVVLYASAARSAEVYVTAANYLQSENWRENLNLEKNIVAFYTKAKAFDQLGLFCLTAAQSYVEDSRNFSRGLDYGQDALKALKKSKWWASSGDSLEKKVKILEELVDIQRSSSAVSEKQAAVRALLSRISDATNPPITATLPEFLTAADICGYLIELLVDNGEYKMAHEECLKLIAGSGEKMAERMLGRSLVAIIEEKTGMSLSLETES